jgi:hypothetical protein
MSLRIEPITAFQTTFIGSPYSAQLLVKGSKPTWQPKVKSKQYADKLKTLPEFIQATDYSIRKVLANIEIPIRFDKSKLYALIMTKLSDDVESDIQLKSFIQTFEKTHASDNSSIYLKTLRRYLTEIDDYTPIQISDFAYMGLQSDISFSVFCDLSLAFITYQKMFKYIVEVAETKLGKLHSKGVRPIFIEKKVASYIHEIKPIMSEYSKTIESQLNLTFYMELANSNTYDELFKPKILNCATMNTETFAHYCKDFQSKLHVLRQGLFDKAPHLFTEKVDPKNPANFVWVISAMQSMGGSANDG